MKEGRKKYTTQYLAQSAVIAALYTVLTLVLAPISYGAVQVRVSEALTILPMFTPAAIPGLFLGCVLANLLGGAIVWDVVFGSLATLIGAALGYKLRKNRWLVPIPTVLANTVIVPLVLRYGYGMPISLPLLMVYILAGELVGCYLLGEVFAFVLLRRAGRFLREGRLGGGQAPAEELTEAPSEEPTEAPSEEPTEAPAEAPGKENGE